MSKIKPILLLVLVFFAGMAIGVVGTRMVVRRIVQEAIKNPDAVRVFLEHRLDRRLKLDAGQQAQLHDILMNAHQEIKDLRQEYRPRFNLIVTEADGKIDAILTPEQQERFEKFKAENPMIWQPGVKKE